MRISQLKKALTACASARLTPWIWGQHGIGKSQVIRQWCDENGYKMFDFRLNTQSDVGDMLGLPDFIRDDKGQAVATNFMMPIWLKESIDFCVKNPDKKAIIFFDELNRASRRDLVGPIFQMSIDHRLHTTEFPKNLHIIVAANPDTEDYSVLNLDDKALMDRFVHISLLPTKEEFFSYASKKDFNKSLVSFLREQPGLLEESGAEFDIKNVVKPSRRSWESFDRLLKSGIDNDVLSDVMQGLVGFTATLAYLKFMENDDKPLTLEQVMNEYPKHHAKVLKHASAAEGERGDLLKVTCDTLIAHFKDEKATVTKEQAINILRFLDACPNDMVYSTLKEIYIKGSMSKYVDNELIGKKLIRKVAVNRGKATPEEAEELKALTEQVDAYFAAEDQNAETAAPKKLRKKFGKSA